MHTIRHKETRNKYYSESQAEATNDINIRESNDINAHI